MKTYKKVLSIGLILVVLLSLTSCSVTVYDEKLEGINVIFAPLYFSWKWFWSDFSNGFWDFSNMIFKTLPADISMIAGTIVYILGGILYLVILAVFLVIWLVVCIITGIIWFILAVLNGIFKFA